nr:hypothetical protein [Tanacetum cinerariifolium]
MARTPMSEHCSAVILNKLPKKLGDPEKFLIPCDFPGMDECIALADLGASINLMPLSVWKELALLELTPTCMTLELIDRSVSKPIGIAKDVSVKVGMFHFPADFVVVDFEPDPRVPLILGSPTPFDDPIVSATSPTLILFGDSDFLIFEEANAFLGLEDDPDSRELDPSYYDLEGDIQMLEAILNSDPAPSLTNHELSVHSFTNELKACEAKTIKSFVDEPPEVELKDLPPHLEYTFLEDDNQLPVIISTELGDEEKAALIKVLKSHKRAIAWKLSDIQGINSEFCTHKILIEEDYKLAVQHQRRVNPKIHNVIKKEVEKLLDVSPVHCVPKKGGFTVVKNEENELIPTRLVTEWRDASFIFSKDCIKAFQTLKHKLTEAPILIAPNWDLPFELMCDASDFAIGAVLGQRYEKHFWLIHYASKILTEAESNYTTTEKEMLAVVYAFEKFRSYLIMNKCIVHTDHSALKYLFAKKDAKARLLPWVLLLQEFDFDVLDTKGAKNLATDHLSRLEKPYENVLNPKEINETFPLETLNTVTFCGDSSAPCDDESSHEEVIREMSFKTYSNPLFDLDEEIISSEFNPIHNEDLDSTLKNDRFDTDSYPLESLLNHDTLMASSLKIDSLFAEFAGELTFLKSIPSGIDEANCDPEEDIHLVERLLYDNSSPRPPKEFVFENSNANIEFFSPSPILVEDSDSRMEEMDLSFTPDDPVPPGIKDDDYDSERDILIREELLDNYSLSLPENESFRFDIPSFSRPPVKLPDGNTGILNIKMMGDISEQKVPMPKLTITRVSNLEKSPDLLSHQGLENFQLYAKCPMMIHGKNIPILDVPLFHFYPLDQLKYGGNWVKLSDQTSASWEATHAYQ